MNLRRWISSNAREIAFGMGALATATATATACDEQTLSSQPRPPSSSSSSSGELSSNGGPCGENVVTLAIDRTCAGDASSPQDAGVCAETTAACATVCARGGTRSAISSCEFGIENALGDFDAGDASPDASSDGGATHDVVRCHTTLYCGGRSYEGAPALDTDGDHVGLGGVFANIAELEWTSVTAFERLARALAHHGAPAELIARAKSFADDERRHAALIASLSHAHGGTPVLLPPSESFDTPSLRSLATENAQEGCVRETFGALVAQVQALRSTSASVREVFAAIADDEARHAELSWDLHAWFLETLTGDDRAEVEASLASAMASLAHTASPHLSSRDTSVFGFDARDHEACAQRLRTFMAASALASPVVAAADPFGASRGA